MAVQRILFIAPTPFFADRGSHTHIAEQAYALQRLGLEVHIVTYHLGRDLVGLPTTRTVRVPWYKKLGPGPSWHKFYVDLLLLWTAWRAVRRFKPDIIHAHLHEGAVIGKILSWWFRIPMVFDVQGSLTGELIAHRFALARPPLDRLWYALERWIDSWGDAVVVQSTEMRDEVEKRFGVPRERILMAYDGVNTGVFKPGVRDPELVRRLGIPADKKVIVYLGGLSPHKGVDTLLEAFPRVLQYVPASYLLLMGYPHEEEYRAKIRDMGLEHVAQVTGRVPYEEAPRYLTLGDIAVAPKRSQTEANGKIYNYMAMGLPTVAFDTVVNRDILGELGVYASPMEDVDGLARELVRLLNDDGRRKQLAERVRAKAVKDYSWDSVAKRLLRAYEQARSSP